LINLLKIYISNWGLKMPLNSHQRQFLKAAAHSLKPVVMLGNDGLSENVIKEIDSSIEHHELIKVKLNAGDTRKEQAAEIATKIGAELISTVGRVAVLFRQRKDDSRFILPR
jgi:RNA-binding protein